MSSQLLASCPKCGSTNVVRHISGEFECLSCGYKWGEGRRYGHPRTEEERRERHKERYGTEELPPRGSALWKKKRRVKAEEIPSFTPAFLSKVKRAYESGKTMTYWEWIIEPSPLYDGVFTYLRGNGEPVKFFPGELIRKMKYDEEKKCYVVKEEEAKTEQLPTCKEDEVLIFEAKRDHLKRPTYFKGDYVYIIGKGTGYVVLRPLKYETWTGRWEPDYRAEEIAISTKQFEEDFVGVCLKKEKVLI